MTVFLLLYLCADATRIQYDLLIATDASACSSTHGLCEPAWEPITVEAA